MGPTQLGMKTLDPSDWAFRGNYDMDDSSSRETARGFNYHQGPEWVWPVGYWLRARCEFVDHDVAGVKHAACVLKRDLTDAGRGALRRWMFARIARHRQHVLESPHGALPELTNANGAGSSPVCARMHVGVRLLLLSFLGNHADVVLCTGAFCAGSCPVQAWSNATIIDAYYDVLHL